MNIEIDPFIKMDLKDIIDCADVSEGGIDSPNELVAEIIAKVAEFVNENYTLKAFNPTPLNS